jgi:hypothetical protein
MAITNNLTNSSIRKFLPSKVITGFAQTIDPLEGWLYDDGTGDPWWQGAMGTPVRWVLTADIFASNHSSHLTRVPNTYTGLDVQPGMWVFSDADPKAVRIVSILSKSDSSISCVVEDVDRYNTFTDPSISGVGIFSPSSNLIFFENGDDGLPILNPLPPNTNISVVSQVEARFRVFNPTVELRFFQVAHGFKEGQVLKINPATGKFEQATSNDIYLAGTVVAVGPGPNFFYLSPSTKVIENLEPGLPGKAGDIIWIDPVNGDRTTDSEGSLVALYIKMTDSVPCFAVGALDYPSSFHDTAFKLNNELITLNGLEGVADLTTIIDSINAGTNQHGVTAFLGSPANRITGINMYPTATPSGPIEFTLNGIHTIVQTPSVTFGTSGQIGWWDIIRAINEQTNKHGVYSSFDTNTGFVSLENSGGGNIEFVNVYPELTEGDDMTVTDMLGIAASNVAIEPSRLKLVREDGGQIAISDINGSFTTDVGIQSADNGKLPLALVVDKTMSASSSMVVSNLSSMYGLTNVRSGDQVFVQNGVTEGEWELYVRTGETFTKISDYDSAATDANTVTIDVSFDSTSPILLGNVSDGARIVDVSVVITQTFDDPNATLSVGVVDEPEAIMSSAIIDLTVIGSYETGTSFMYSGDADGDVYVFLDAGSSTTGRAQVIVSYM